MKPYRCRTCLRWITYQGLDEILVLVDGSYQQTETERRDMRAMFALTFEALGPDAELRERMAEFTTGMRTDLAAALRRGQTDSSVRGDLDPDATAVLIASTLQGLAYEWLLQPEAIDLGRAYAALRDMLRDYLATA